MVQVLAQAQAKTQQAQTVANITQRPATPTAGATIRVSTATTVGLVLKTRLGLWFSRKFTIMKFSYLLTVESGAGPKYR